MAVPGAGLGGLADGQWKTSRVLLEATAWQTLRSIDGLFQLRLTYPAQRSGGRPLPVDRVRLRFVEDETFRDEREADRVERGLIRLDFADPTEAPTSPQPGAPYALYARALLDKVYPNSVPRPAEVLAPGQGLSAFEVAGEREPVSLSMYAYRDVHGVAVTPTDLVRSSSPGDIIPAATVSVAPVGVLDKRWAFSYDARYGANPWVLLDPTAQDVPAGTSRQFWVTVNVPPWAGFGLNLLAAQRRSIVRLRLVIGRA